MTRTLKLLPASSSNSEKQSTFNVVIAYEDLAMGKQAKSTYDFLVEKLGAECDFTNQMWKFEVLSIPHLREVAAKDAAKADIIIIACHGQGLPFEVKAWIELWLAEPHRPFALVAMFDAMQDQAYFGYEVHRYLADVAKRGEIEFFAQPEENVGIVNTEELFPLQRSSGMGEYDLTVLPGLFKEHDSSFPRWGINE